MSTPLRVLIGICLAGLLAACSSPEQAATPTPGQGAPSAAATLTQVPTQPPARTPLPSPTQQPTASEQSTASQQPASEQPTAAPPVASPTLAAATAAPAPNGIPDAAQYTWQPVVSGLAFPVGIANAGDGSGRLFVLEKSGRIRIVQDGALVETPFLDITARVGSRSSEQGLLGLAFHPHYPDNGYFYVNYTDKNGDTVIARYQVTAQDPNQADPQSEKRLLQVDQPFANHNGGEVTFGPDGYLYLGLGDGGSGGDPHNNGQSLDTFLGKILRLDVDHGDPYAIPPDNPFAQGKAPDGSPAKPEIWAYGLRNPWRFSFDAQTGDLYIADVGQNSWEEIDFLPAGTPGGTNFGWNFYEATHPFQGTPPEGLQLVMPVAEYSHAQGCSVTGGYVYRGARLPEWQGIYLYGDYCSGNVWALARTAQGNWYNEQVFTNVTSITSFGVDEQGEVYLVDASDSLYLLTKK